MLDTIKGCGLLVAAMALSACGGTPQARFPSGTMTVIGAALRDSATQTADAEVTRHTYSGTWNAETDTLTVSVDNMEIPASFTNYDNGYALIESYEFTYTDDMGDMDDANDVDYTVLGFAGPGATNIPTDDVEVTYTGRAWARGRYRSDIMNVGATPEEIVDGTSTIDVNFGAATVISYITLNFADNDNSNIATITAGGIDLSTAANEVGRFYNPGSRTANILDRPVGGNTRSINPSVKVEGQFYGEGATHMAGAMAMQSTSGTLRIQAWFVARRN